MSYSFERDKFDAGTPLQVQEGQEWRECMLYRANQGSRVVLWFGVNEYEGLHHSVYTINEEGTIRDGDGEEVPSRLGGSGPRKRAREDVIPAQLCPYCKHVFPRTKETTTGNRCFARK